MIKLVAGKTIVAPKALGSSPSAFLFPSPLLPLADHHHLRIYRSPFHARPKKSPEIRVCVSQVEGPRY